MALGLRRLGHVVRHRRPQRDGRDAGRGAGLLQHADDAGRALVVHRVQVQPVGQGGVRGGRRHRHRAGVRGVGQQRAEQHHGLHLQLGERRDQLAAEAPPAHVRLDAVHQHHVAAQSLGRATLSRVVGQTRSVGLPVGDFHHRPGDLEVVEVLGIDLADGPRIPGRAEVIHGVGRRLARVVPALEGGYQNRCGELADGIEIEVDRPPPPSAAACLVRRWGSSLRGRGPPRRGTRCPGQPGLRRRGHGQRRRRPLP